MSELANKRCHPTYYLEVSTGGTYKLKLRNDGLTFREQLILNLASNSKINYHYIIDTADEIIRRMEKMEPIPNTKEDNYLKD